MLHLIHLLHGGSRGRLERRGSIVILILLDGGLLRLVDREAEGNHVVDAVGEAEARTRSAASRGRTVRRKNVLDGSVEGEARGEEGSLVEEDDQRLDGLVGGILLDLAAELLDDGVVGVDLEGLLRLHVYERGKESVAGAGARQRRTHRKTSTSREEPEPS